MKNNVMKGLVLAMFGMAAGNAVAAEIYYNEDATLTCQTSSVCGQHTSTHEVTVYESNGQRTLEWHNNSPSSTPAPDIYTAYTIGGACASVDPVSNFTAVWTLAEYGRPTKAIVTMCDGVTTAEYKVTVAKVGPDPDKGDGGCISLPWSICTK